MYLGHIVEWGPAREVYENPSHPYSRALLSAVPEIPSEDIEQRERILLTGEPPNPIAPPPGCPFHPRCAYVMDACAEAYPPTAQVGPEHYASCLLYHGDKGPA
jgi:peptide/nickel transport system ATP-binding protein